MPDRYFRQEYLCEFLEPTGAVYTAGVVDRAPDDSQCLFTTDPRPPFPFDQTHYIGVDLGQAQDYTAIAILEKAVYDTKKKSAWDWSAITETRRVIRHLERLPLNTSYSQIVARIRHLARHPLVKNPIVIVDATGCGRPVIDMLRDADLGCTLVPVLFTGGGSTTSDGYYWRVPKNELLTGLEIAFQNEQLKIARELEDTPILLQELRNLRRKVKDTGDETIAPWRHTQHDDFVYATALANWRCNVRL